MADHTESGGKKAPRTLFSLGRSGGSKNPPADAGPADEDLDAGLPTTSDEASSPTVQLDAAATTKFCANCGGTLPVYAKFCGECGSQQPEVSQATAEGEAPVADEVEATDADADDAEASEEPADDDADLEVVAGDEAAESDEGVSIDAAAIAGAAVLAADGELVGEPDADDAAIDEVEDEVEVEGEDEGEDVELVDEDGEPLAESDDGVEYEYVEVEVDEDGEPLAESDDGVEYEYVEVEVDEDGEPLAESDDDAEYEYVEVDEDEIDEDDDDGAGVGVGVAAAAGLGAAAVAGGVLADDAAAGVGEGVDGVAGAEQPAAVLYADPGAVEDLPPAPDGTFEVAEPITGSATDDAAADEALGDDETVVAPIPVTPPPTTPEAPAATISGGGASRTPLIVGGIAAAVVALIVGLLVFGGGGDDDGEELSSGTSNTEPVGPPVTEDGTTSTTEEEDTTSTTEDDGPTTTRPEATTTTRPTTTSTPGPTTQVTTPTTPRPTAPPTAPPTTPGPTVVVGSPNLVLTATSIVGSCSGGATFGIRNDGNGIGTFSVQPAGATANPSSGAVQPGQTITVRLTGQGCPRDYATTATVLLPTARTVGVTFTDASTDARAPPPNLSGPGTRVRPVSSASLVAWAAGRHPSAPPLPAGRPVASLAPRPGDRWSADAVGLAYEQSLAAVPRQAAGAFYTPRAIAEGVVALALPDPLSAAPVLDPAVGGGAFLLAAARRLERSGASRREIVERSLFGIDNDPGALEATAVALALWAGPDAAGWPDARPNLHLADTIATPPEDLRALLGSEIQTVVGNPPFLGQLRTRTARVRDHAARVEAALPGVGGAYTDAAALFLLTASRLVRPGGRVALLVPESLLSARDAEGVRAAVLEDAVLEHLWVAGEPVFSVATRVCAPVLRRRSLGDTSRPGRVGRSVGAAFGRVAAGRPTGDPPGSWGHLVAGLHGVPTVELGDGPALATWAEVTAGFRQQFYGVQPVVVEGDGPGAADDDRPWLVTSGTIDPLVCRWGEVPTSFARQRWAAPRIDLAALVGHDEALHRWALARLRPKVVVATQTRVVEAAVDVDGRWYPSTPTLAVAPPEDRPDLLWPIAAVLCAPPVTAWLHHRLGGSALAAGHLRITASALRAVPLPPPGAALERGSELARQVWETNDPATHRPCLLELGRCMTEAYGAADEVFDWWAEHLPAPR